MPSVTYFTATIHLPSRGTEPNCKITAGQYVPRCQIYTTHMNQHKRRYVQQRGKKQATKRCPQMAAARGKISPSITAMNDPTRPTIILLPPWKMKRSSYSWLVVETRESLSCKTKRVINLFATLTKTNIAPGFSPKLHNIASAIWLKNTNIVVKIPQAVRRKTSSAMPNI